MARIYVKLEASYGYGCGGCYYGSDDTFEMEVDVAVVAALRELGSGEISSETVAKAIEDGATVLESLHEELSAKFYYMVEEYWLFEADNECLYECLRSSIEQDISDGLYSPIVIETEDDEDEYADDEECDEDDEEEYDLDDYYEWVKSHSDHGFIADRVGLDLFACRDYAVCYTITLAE